MYIVLGKERETCRLGWMRIRVDSFPNRQSQWPTSVLQISLPCLTQQNASCPNTHLALSLSIHPSKPSPACWTRPRTGRTRRSSGSTQCVGTSATSRSGARVACVVRASRSRFTMDAADLWSDALHLRCGDQQRLACFLFLAENRSVAVAMEAEANARGLSSFWGLPAPPTCLISLPTVACGASPSTYYRVPVPLATSCFVMLLSARLGTGTRALATTRTRHPLAAESGAE